MLRPKPLYFGNDTEAAVNEIDMLKIQVIALREMLGECLEYIDIGDEPLEDEGFFLAQRIRNILEKEPT